MDKTQQSIFRKVQQVTIVTLLLLNFIAGVGWAAPAPDAQSIEEQNNRSRKDAEEREQRNQSKNVFLQKETTKTEEITLPEEEGSYYITEIKLEGSSVGRFSWAQDMLNRYAGRRIGAKGIQLIVQRLNNAFVDRGYITTRIAVPEQNLSEGTLRLTLVPGIIRDIRFRDTKIRGNWRTAFPAGPGEILNLRQLEQGLEQMLRLPSQDVDIQIVPGNNQGESDILISKKQVSNPVRVTTSLDDSGTRETGKLQAAAGISVDNPLNINDSLNISLNNDADFKRNIRGTRGESIEYSFPYGYYTISFSSYWNKHYQTIEGFINNLTYSGEETSQQLRITKLIHRDQNSKTNLEFTVKKDLRKMYLEDTEIEVQRRNTTSAQLGLSHRRIIGEKILDVQLACKWGVPWFGANSDYLGEGSDKTDRYKLGIFELDYITPAKIDKYQARYRSTFHIQYTRDHLDSLEYFSIGNRYTVRGFNGEQMLSSDWGWFLRNELSFPLDKKGNALYLGLDCGQVKGFGAQYLQGDFLAGSVIGVRGLVKKVQYDVFVGTPVKEPAGFDTDKLSAGFRVMYQL